MGAGAEAGLHADETTLTFPVEAGGDVSGILRRPGSARACFVLAHGTGAGMRHPFLQALAEDLASRGIATLRYQFPYMEQGRRRPDPAPLAQACVRAAVSQASALVPSLPLVAGGRSFGGRMTSQAQAAAPLPRVRGLVFLGFPLHPAGRPSTERADHLGDIQVPMLFLQGTRDALSEAPQLDHVAQGLGAQATFVMLEDADHGFQPRVRSGRTQATVRAEMADAIVRWLEREVL